MTPVRNRRRRVANARSRRRRVAAISTAALIAALTAGFLVVDRGPEPAAATPASTPEVIAHRGASSVAPENTLISGEVARRAGTDWIENDVRTSLDGVPYVLHDGTVDRTTDGKGKLGKLTAEEIDKLDAGAWFAPSYKGTRIPTLAAQLADLRERGGRLLLDITGTRDKTHIATIVRTVKEERMTDRVLVQSFFPESLEQIREILPEVPRALLRNELDPDPVKVAKDLGVTAYNISDKGLQARPEAVAELRAAGIAVNVWVVDDPARWKALADLGVTGIITDRAPELVGWNAARSNGR